MTQTYSIRMEEPLKQQFDALCADFGISPAAAFNILARNAVREWKFPFSVPASGRDEPFNAETIAALEEGEEMLKNPSKYKRYATFREAMDEVLRDA